MNPTLKLSAASLFALASALTAAACDNTDKTTPSTTGAVSSAPVVAQQNKVVEPMAAPSAPTMAAMPAALVRPVSIYLVDDKSVSRVTDDEMLAAAKKAGWAKDGTTVTPMTAGQYESRSFPIEKGKTKGTVKIVRPTATPGTTASANGFVPPSQLGASMNAQTSAYTYDPDGDVFVGVDLDGGKSAEAKQILDKMVVKGKAQVGGADMTGASSGSGENAAMENGKAADKGHNTKDSNSVPPKADGKANSAPRNPTKDSNSIPPKRESN